jgi:hypothetical protein
MTFGPEACLFPEDSESNSAPPIAQLTRPTTASATRAGASKGLKWQETQFWLARLPGGVFVEWHTQ